MRSQTTKSAPKKGPLKTSLKKGFPSKVAKRKPVTPKKVIKKSLVKSPKKSSSRENVNKSVEEPSPCNEVRSETNSSGPSKGNASRSNSPSKKLKKQSKEKKDAPKISPGTKKLVTKKLVETNKKANMSPKSKKYDLDSDDIKYKINLEAMKLAPSKFSKAKTVVTKKNTSQKAKITSSKNQDIREKELTVVECKKVSSNENSESADDVYTNEEEKDKIIIEKVDIHSTKGSLPTTPVNVTSQPELQKPEIERPPKFFTSTRSPRTVDIDVKCFKNAKGNLSVSERFLSMKCETKSDDTIKDKNAFNTLVSPGPEIDVYTFTEKVDSPKSILSDFRNPINKNVGRVRPIARVKGTIIDKKTDLEKKKYSPHRPIEEVVKQLKANKRSEEVNSAQNQESITTSSEDSSAIFNEKEIEDKPKPIVSKSYKMVARKSSITGKPFSPIKFLDQETTSNKLERPSNSPGKKAACKVRKQKKISVSDDDLETSKFSLNTQSFQYSSADEGDNDTKTSEKDASKVKKTKNKKYRRITDGAKKTTSKELKELSKDSLIDIKDSSDIKGSEKHNKRHRKLESTWSGPKKHRMASLNARAKVHCLYENENRSHVELGLLRPIDLAMDMDIDPQITPSTSKCFNSNKKKEIKISQSEKESTTSESEYDNKKSKKGDSSESCDDIPPQRSLRGVPGIRSAGKYWDPKSSTSSSEDSELDYQNKPASPDKKKTNLKTCSAKSDIGKPPAKMKKTVGVPVKKKRNRNEVVMDLKDMVVQKRMASLNATAILAASYEKRSPKSSKDDTTSDSCSDESFSQKSKNGLSSGVKSEIKNEDIKKDSEESPVPDLKQKLEVIVNQDTDVTITGVYSTHLHEGFCTVSGMQYRISATSHTQTTATANCDKEGCSRDEGARYTPLSALSSMQPPAEHSQSHPHPVPELGGLTRRGAGCSSAFSAPSPAASAQHEPGYYQPAGPLIKETAPEAERALARYHPAPHYHAPHPPVLQQYGPPYYPPDLCYGRYYRPQGPYHMPPQPDSQMVGVGSEPYPPQQYYGTPPCYQHSPQRIPYVEYRGCPCPLNACPKNVLIGPATGKALTGAGPDVHPPGGCRAVRRALDAATDSHGSGKDPPLIEPEPPTRADARHPCPVPAIGGASPKRELYDVRDNMRLAGDIPGPEALGPPSPARGSAGACAPQPPPIAPRRARLGKAMARRSLAGDDTNLLISTPQPTQAHSDADDDVMAISPPICAPIDLSSSDERSTPLVDVKKENEGPTCAASRKTDAQALREHNSSTVVSDSSDNSEANKASKRRHSRSNLEIDMKDTLLEESLKTNGIGEHVKLQKRRKVSVDQATVNRTDILIKDSKKKTPQGNKRMPKTPTEKKSVKRKLTNMTNSPKAKRMLIVASVDEVPRLKNVAALPDQLSSKPKTKSALLLDNLIRKNSIDRVDAKGYASDKELNPAELFLGNVSQSSDKNTLNINNNIVESIAPVSGVRPNTLAAVTQLIEKKLATKNACKLEQVDSKMTHSLKSVLKTPTDNLKLSYKPLTSPKCKTKSENNGDIQSADCKDKREIKDSVKSTASDNISIEKDLKTYNIYKTEKVEKVKNDKLAKESHSLIEQSDNDNLTKTTEDQSLVINKLDKPKRCKLGTKFNGQMKTKSIEKVAKLLGSKKPEEIRRHNQDNVDGEKPKECFESLITKPTEKQLEIVSSQLNQARAKNIEKITKLLDSRIPTTIKESSLPVGDDITRACTRTSTEMEKRPETSLPKRCKLTNGELKSKNVEKVVKLLVSKKPAIKTDEATLVVEDACASPVTVGKRARRRRSGAGTRRVRRAPLSLIPPALTADTQPRWSNGWQWDSEDYLSKVYLSNDSRLDKTARCWTRMKHESGDSITRGDCVLLRANTPRAQPFVARVASLWENPDDREMMVSLVWYYRPEHTERGREPSDAPDEVFASRHRDANSVACIEDKCYVLTFNEYCRYRKRLKAAEEGITITPSIVPPLPSSEITPAVAPNDSKLPPSVSPELVLFCRKIYDFRSKKIQPPSK